MPGEKGKTDLVGANCSLLFPGLDAAGKVIYFGKAFAMEKLSRNSAASAYSSINDDGLFWIEFIEALIKLSYRNQLCPGNVAGLVLFGLSNVQEGETAG